jgi:antitoxin component of RelBE/YafQ-DinJ toxin-antitoxin module
MPALKSMPAGTTPVATRLDARALARAEAAARSLGLTMSGLLQVALASYLDRQDQAVAVSEIAAAAASVRDAVASLNARDSGVVAQLASLTEALKGVGSEAL